MRIEHLFENGELVEKSFPLVPVKECQHLCFDLIPSRCHDCHAPLEEVLRSIDLRSRRQLQAEAVLRMLDAVRTPQG
jgi:hypothetical protein